MIINDIERNGYCFTDGNGFISKGLAKCVADKLSLCSKLSKHDVCFLYPVSPKELSIERKTAKTVVGKFDVPPSLSLSNKLSVKKR